MERRHLAECGSTNTEALQHLRDGGGPLLVSASRQTAGRGRLGRAWLTDQAGNDAALTFSVAVTLPAELDLSGLSLAVGCTVADALDPDGERIRLKWPNDLFLDGAKLGGILIETVPLPDQRRGVVIGIGLNLQPLPPEADRGAFASGHAALQSLDPSATAGATLDRLAPALRAMLADFETLGFAPWQAAFGRRDLAAGRRVRVGDQPGVARGVSPRGELLLETAAGVLPMSGGELSLRLETSP
ncbi:MAG: biotin--[acetyl-CoA-carboxylase] ligase [Burkholderiales bacterium]|jgi:BirA family biotin operon repressor/biotin-[acetyl-CoA-carboxylase] ligase|nr:biotin--[acetyl-CoA-carboxylase] ligase [Burkholderiales bacterium]